MRYQDRAIEVQADEADEAADAGAILRSAAQSGPELAAANINPQTGLATDYLNHFNEAIMLLELVATCPDCLDDFNRWQAMSYREHFLASKLKARDLAIAAYETADPAARETLDGLAATMTTVIEATRKTITDDLSPLAAGPLADRAAAWLKILVSRAGAVINGETDATQPDAPQAAVDRLMRRKA
jgi:hypothetical protein